jgi:hypothetical protein
MRAFLRYRRWLVCFWILSCRASFGINEPLWPQIVDGHFVPRDPACAEHLAIREGEGRRYFVRIFGANPFYLPPVDESEPWEEEDKETLVEIELQGAFVLFHPPAGSERSPIRLFANPARLGEFKSRGPGPRLTLSLHEKFRGQRTATTWLLDLWINGRPMSVELIDRVIRLPYDVPR